MIVDLMKQLSEALQCGLDSSLFSTYLKLECEFLVLTFSGTK